MQNYLHLLPLLGIPIGISIVWLVVFIEEKNTWSVCSEHGKWNSRAHSACVYCPPKKK
jgi:hypothetical protein